MSWLKRINFFRVTGKKGLGPGARERFVEGKRRIGIPRYVLEGEGRGTRGEKYAGVLGIYEKKARKLRGNERRESNSWGLPPLTMLGLFSRTGDIFNSIAMQGK